MSGSSQEDLLENWPRRDLDVDHSNLRLLGAVEQEEPVRRGTLLEDWPRRESITITSDDSSFDSTAPQAEDNDTSMTALLRRMVESITFDRIITGQRRKQLRRHVDFSETSRLYVYKRESLSLLRSLSYTKKDYDEFGREAMLEGLRIKDIIATTPHDSDANSIKYLLRHGVISKEELVGIEHFVLGKPSAAPKMRKLHAAAVLWKQQEVQDQKLEDPVLDLAKFARSSSLSLRSTKSARIRAGRAA
jgi:hypothetical protein